MQSANKLVDSAYVSTEQGPHHRVWQQVSYETLPTGEVVSRPHRFTELQTGLNYWDGSQWLPSRERIRVFPGGAVASEGQHKVWFPYDIYTGFIRMTLPDETARPLRSQVVGLSYSDGTDSVLIAAVTNSVGHVLPTGNQVLYTNCFSGVRASLRYTYRKDSFEQDVLLESQLPPPSAFGLSSAAYLEVVTEFVDPPEAVTRGQNLDPRLQDIDFGSMLIGRGRAFVFGNDEKSVEVLKDWVILDGRQFLFEQVPLQQIDQAIRTLPALRQASIRRKPVLLRTAQGRHVLPRMRLAQTSTNMIRTAEVKIAPGTLVLDYSTVNPSLTNYVFDGGTTYYLSGNVTLYGTNTVFEGNAVLKYATNTTLTVNTPVTWLADSFRPVILTAKDDDRVGEVLPDSTSDPGNQQYAATAFYFNASSANASLSVRNLRVLNAGTAVALNGKNGHVLSHVQVLNCGNGVAATNTDFALRNALFYNVQTNFTGSSATGRVEHLTSDIANWLNKDIDANLFLTNCLLVGVTNTGSYTGQNVSFASSGVGVFQTAGAADHYLVSGSTNRDAGTANINAALLTDLKLMTTYPPTVISNITLAFSTNFNVQVQRDVNTLDIGYHYDPIDYALGGVQAVSNVTVAAGTIIGWFELPGADGPGFGLAVSNGMQASFNGTFAQPCGLIRYSTVQEGANSLWKDKGWLAGVTGQGSDLPSPPAQLAATFTHFSHVAAEPGHFRDYGAFLKVQLLHCEIWGTFGGYALQGGYTNCLVDRCDFWQGASSSPPYAIFRNCTFHGGSFGITHWEAGAPYWYSSVRYCTFDGLTSLAVDHQYGTNSAYGDYDYNAFLSGATQFPAQGTNNKTVSTFNWQNGRLGRYYLPNNSSLINAGNATADTLGLYHFTTQILQAKEANSLVDALRLGDSIEEDASAKTSGTRPLFNQMVNRIKKNEANAILCWHVNRLSRNAGDTAALVELMDQGKLLEIRTPSQTFRNTPSDKFLITLFCSQAKLENDNKGVDVERGLRKKAGMGWYPGVAPMGYLNDKTKLRGERDLYKDPERFDLVKRMWQMMATGTYTPPQILKIANEEWGFRTRRTRKQGDNPLSITGLYHIFHNPFYYGWFEYPRRNGKWYEGKHEPMITKAEFDRVQAILGRNGNPRASKHPTFSYTGIIRCGACPGMITAEEKHNIRCTNCRLKFVYRNRDQCPRCTLPISKMSNPILRDYTYYHCARRKGGCNQSGLEVTQLERQIAEQLRRFHISNQFKSWAFEFLQEIHREDVDAARHIVSYHDKSYADCEKRLSNLIKLKTSPENSDGKLLSDEEYLKQRQELLEEKARLKKSPSDMRIEAHQALQQSEAMFEFAESAFRQFPEADFRAKKQILTTMGSHQRLLDKKLIIEARRPFILLGDFLESEGAENDLVAPENILGKQGQKLPVRLQSSRLLRDVKDVRTKSPKFKKMVMAIYHHFRSGADVARCFWN